MSELPTTDERVTADVLRTSYRVMAQAFNRVHGLPRATDTVIAENLGQARGAIERLFKDKGWKLT